MLFLCWCRVPTSYDSDSGVLTIQHTPECDAVQYSYFAHYTYNKHRCLIARMQVSDDNTVEQPHPTQQTPLLSFGCWCVGTLMLAPC